MPEAATSPAPNATAAAEDSEEEQFDYGTIRPKFVPGGYEKLNKNIYSMPLRIFLRRRGSRG